MKRTITTSIICSLICLFFLATINAQSIPGTGAGAVNNNKALTNITNNHAMDNLNANGLTQLYSATGKYTLSADGHGLNSVTGGPVTYDIRVNKPTAAATVFKAFFMAVSTNASIPAGCVSLATNTIVWDASTTIPWGYGNFYNYEADVTSIVAPLINPLGAGISTLSVGECFIAQVPANGEALDGTALLIIFSDATTAEKTIIIMWGAINPLGDSYSIVLGTPIDPAAPGALLDMGLGIGYSYQGTAQYSQVDVNGARLTTSAGGQDDGTDFNGGLITVGGIGDSDANPADPNALPVNQFSDDELYSLLPFITNTTSNITVATSNPSDDDNIFLSYFVLNGSAIILNGSGVVLSQSTTSGCTGITHTVTALVVDGQSNPISGVTVNFSVTSGPDVGLSGSATSDVNGHASFTYTGSGGVGIDQIQACVTLFTSPPICSNVLNFQWNDCTTCIPTLSEWGLIILAMLLMAASLVYIRRSQYSFAGAGATDSTEGRKTLFNRRSYFMILAILLGIALVIFTVEIILAIEVPVRDIIGGLVSSAILAYILQLLIPYRKE